MRKLIEIYWLAGLLDGEGWFGFQATPHINISQTDLDIVEKAKSIFGNCPPIKTYHSERANRKTKYVLTVNGNLAISWMMTIYPIMSIRRKSQIRNVIEKWKLMIGISLETRQKNMAKANMVRVLAIAKNISLEEAKELIDNTLKVN